MKIIVCVKQVPDTETRIRVAEGGKTIVENDVNWIVSPYDEFAIEEALRIKEKKGGGEVILVAVGPDRVQGEAHGGVVFCADLIPGRPWVHVPITMGYDRNAELLIDERELEAGRVDAHALRRERVVADGDQRPARS